ncbi:MAG: hypothetical protein AAB840_02650, partial [Patescibacteria group bacterium]
YLNALQKAMDADPHTKEMISLPGKPLPNLDIVVEEIKKEEEAIRLAETETQKASHVEKYEKTVEIPMPASVGEQEAKDLGMEEELHRMTRKTLDEELLSIFFKKTPLSVVGGKDDNRKQWGTFRNKDVSEVLGFGAKYVSEDQNSPFVSPDRDRILELWKLIEQKRIESGVPPSLAESVDSYLFRSTRAILAKRFHPSRK